MKRSSTPLPPTTMQEPIVDEALAAAHGLDDDEYGLIREILGRTPSYTELGITSSLWSEHCSYKSSKIYLREFPTTGPRVLQGPGENAGVVDIGHGWVAGFQDGEPQPPQLYRALSGRRDRCGVAFCGMYSPWVRDPSRAWIPCVSAASMRRVCGIWLTASCAGSVTTATVSAFQRWAARPGFTGATTATSW